MSISPLEFFLLFIGLIAGFIDSIAGGGGLITVPVFSILLGPGSTAIGTNKIVALIASLAALLIYARAGHITLKGNRTFAALVGIGALLGAIVSPSIPAEAYKWLVIAIVPFILFIVIRKDLWVRHQTEDAPVPRKKWIFLLAGFACGFYDGVAGPGGGTLMFLALFLVARLPLLTSMATAKVANLASASLSLASYAYTGHVIWTKGVAMGLGIGIGAAIGASLATKRAALFARTALVIVAVALAIRLAFS